MVPLLATAIANAGEGAPATELRLMEAAVLGRRVGGSELSGS